MIILSDFLPDDGATAHLGCLLAQHLQPGLHLHLEGPLGAGKTSIVRALLQQLGHKGAVKSPTYGLVESYSLELQPNSRIDFYHFDFYRFNRDNEWLEAGFRDYFRHDSVCLVEWPEQAGDLLPPPDVQIRLQYVSEDTAAGRVVELVAMTDNGSVCLKQLIIARTTHSG